MSSMLLRAGRRTAQASRARALPRNPAAPAALRRLLSGKAFDHKALIEERADVLAQFNQQAEVLERMLPTEYAAAVASLKEDDALVEKARKAMENRDEAAFEEARKQITSSVDKNYKQLLEQVRQANVVARKNYREVEWAEQALAEGRTTEAYGQHEDAGMVGASGMFEKYGASTLIGFASIIATAKAVYLPNEETLVVLCFASFIATAYIGLRDQVTSGLKEGTNTMVKEHEASMDKYIDVIRKARAFYKDSKAVASELHEVASHYRNLEKEFVATRPQAFKHKLVKDLEKDLARFENAENNHLSKIPTLIADRVKANVLNYMKNEADSGASIDRAIAKLANATEEGIVEEENANNDGEWDLSDPTQLHQAYVEDELLRWARRRGTVQLDAETRALVQDRFDSEVAGTAEPVNPNSGNLDGLDLSAEDRQLADLRFKMSKKDGECPKEMTYVF